MDVQFFYIQNYIHNSCPFLYFIDKFYTKIYVRIYGSKLSAVELNRSRIQKFQYIYIYIYIYIYYQYIYCQFQKL